MRKLAISHGGIGVRGRRCMEGRCDDLELDVGHLASCRKGLLPSREDSLLWMGQTLPARIPLVVRPPSLLVCALLA